MDNSEDIKNLINNIQNGDIDNLKSHLAGCVVAIISMSELMNNMVIQLIGIANKIEIIEKSTGDNVGTEVLNTLAALRELLDHVNTIAKANEAFIAELDFDYEDIDSAFPVEGGYYDQHGFHEMPPTQEDTDEQDL
jgi:hypothetical protein